MKQKQYRNKFNKVLKNSPHEKKSLKKTQKVVYIHLNITSVD